MHDSVGKMKNYENFLLQLFENKFKTVEKIKVAGSTYLAACGLHPGQKDSKDLIRRKESTKMVVILAEFAANVLRRLEKINKDFKTDFKLRIGGDFIYKPRPTARPRTSL